MRSGIGYGCSEDESRMAAEYLCAGSIGDDRHFFVNSFLEKQGIAVGVGINVTTVLTSAILGFPGVFALYGIGFYKIL